MSAETDEADGVEQLLRDDWIADLAEKLFVARVAGDPSHGYLIESDARRMAGECFELAESFVEESERRQP